MVYGFNWAGKNEHFSKVSITKPINTEAKNMPSDDRFEKL